jgi:hypothetical protein
MSSCGALLYFTALPLTASIRSVPALSNGLWKAPMGRALPRHACNSMAEPSEASGLASDDPAVLFLQAAPLVASAAASNEGFAVIYVPLALLGRAAEASPSATLALSTLLYSTGATVAESVEAEPLLLLCVINLTIAAALLKVERADEVDDEQAMMDDDFARFDKRLKDAVNSKQKRPPKRGLPRLWRGDDS